MPEPDEPAYPQADIHVTLRMIEAGEHYLARHVPLPHGIARPLLVSRLYQIMVLVGDHQPDRARRLAEAPLG